MGRTSLTLTSILLLAVLAEPAIAQSHRVGALRQGRRTAYPKDSNRAPHIMQAAPLIQVQQAYDLGRDERALKRFDSDQPSAERFAPSNIGEQVLSLCERTPDSCDSSRQGAYAPCDRCWGCNSCSSYSPSCVAGFALTFLTPRYNNNVALTTTTSDGVGFESVDVTQFHYGLKVAPRVWLEYIQADGLGCRVRYWQFDHSSSPVTGYAPANGFGEITLPQFGNIAISTTVPGESVTTTSGLAVNALDLEGSKHFILSRWSLLGSAGIRYGSIKQNYQAQLFGINSVVQDAIDFHHNFDGIGPTIAFEARCALASRFSVFCAGRGSLLFGSWRTTLAAGEELDLTTPFFTNTSNDRDGSLPVAELQLGIDWETPIGAAATVFWQGAMEAQYWQEVGSASSESGSLGLFGFNTAVGVAF